MHKTALKETDVNGDKSSFKVYETWKYTLHVQNFENQSN